MKDRQNSNREGSQGDRSKERDISTEKGRGGSSGGGGRQSSGGGSGRGNQ